MLTLSSSSCPAISQHLRPPDSLTRSTPTQIPTQCEEQCAQTIETSYLCQVCPLPLSLYCLSTPNHSFHHSCPAMHVHMKQT